jgi:xanthine dehydrogenase accessory factor
MSCEFNEAFLNGVISCGQQSEVFLATLINDKGEISRILLSNNGFILKSGLGGNFVDLVAQRLQEKCLELFSSKISLIVQDLGNGVKLVVESIKPRASILILGAGHVGRALALISAISGYTVKVVDDRAEFLTRERIPNESVELILCPFDRISDEVTITPSTSVVIVTRGHQYDEICLQQVVGSCANYIGMIGSKRRVIGVFKRLAGRGIPWNQLKKVHAPIGLDIGAVSPQEIAVSILAEIIQVISTESRKGKANYQLSIFSHP